MMTETFDCVECGAAVPYGRLSCPSCGALLASVTGGRNPAVRVAEVASEPKSQVAQEPIATATTVAVAEAPATGSNPTKATRRRQAPAATPFMDSAAAGADPGPSADPASPVAAATAPAAPAAAAAVPATLPGTPRTPHYAPTPAAAARARIPAPRPDDASADVLSVPTPASDSRASAEAERAAIVPLLEPAVVAAVPETPWAPLVEPAPALTGRPYQRHLAAENDPASGSPPSAYKPPSQSVAMATAAALGSSGASDGRPVADVTGAGAAQGTVARHANRLFGTLADPTRFLEMSGWFIIVGATMSLLGFLLPWSRVVIGASAVGGYFDGWGLASPTHLLVFIGLLAILALAILRDPVPAWISSGVLGLVSGGLLLGLAWPYLVGPLGADIGLTLTTLGGIALLIGGVVALWATRHAAARPLV